MRKTSKAGMLPVVLCDMCKAAPSVIRDSASEWCARCYYDATGTHAPPPGPMLTPPADVVCACGETLAHADGVDLVLHVYEQGVILRPHVLRPLDLPLTWNCPRCGVQSIIPAR